MVTKRSINLYWIVRTGGGGSITGLVTFINGSVWGYMYSPGPRLRCGGRCASGPLYEGIRLGFREYARLIGCKC